jgi:lipid-A-disaccharide synthase
MVAAAKRVHAARPDARFLVASFNQKQAAAARGMLAGSGLPAEVHVGRTPEVIDLADAAVAVSGSVGLELMYRRTPTVVVYKLKPVELLIARPFIKARYISLVNLLAGEELFPEYLTARDESAAMAGHVLRWLNDPPARTAAVARLQALRDRVAVPGACDRAAAVLTGPRPARRAA